MLTLLQSHTAHCPTHCTAIVAKHGQGIAASALKDMTYADAVIR
jgi:hypothetical protein